jgi:hypothetical protein
VWLLSKESFAAHRVGYPALFEVYEVYEGQKDMNVIIDVSVTSSLARFWDHIIV